MRSILLTGACIVDILDMPDFESAFANKSKLLILIFIRSDPTAPRKNETSIVNDR